MTALAVFTAGLESLEFIRLDCRFGIFTREMLENGMSFFPTVYGKAYPDYPAAQTVLMYLSSLLRGELSMLTTTLPSSLAASLTLVGIYLIGVLHSRRLALYGVLFAFGTYAFVFAARTPSTDIFVAAASTLAFYAACSAEHTGRNFRLAVIPLAFVFGFFFRGPLGLVIPTAVVFAYYLVNMKIRKAFFTGLIACICMVLCVCALYFAAKAQIGKEFADGILNAQMHDRLEKQRSLFYYFYKGFGVYSLSYTVAFVFVILNLGKILNMRNNNPELLMIRSLLGWALIILIGMSIPGTKHTRYILPAAPAFALLAAFVFARTDKAVITAPLQLFLSWTGRLLPFILTAVAIALGIILGIFSISLKLNVFLLIIFFTLISFSLLLCLSKFKTSEDRDIISFSHGIISFLVLVLFVVEPLQQWMESSKEFVFATEKHLAADSLIYFYRTGPDGEDLKYVVNLKRRMQPEFFSAEEDIAALKPNSIIVIPEKELASMSEKTTALFDILSKGKLGHEPFVSVKIKAAEAVD